MARAFDNRHRAFKKGDLVFTVRRPMILTHKSEGKFEPKWEGPYVVDQVYSNRIYALLNLEGDRCMMPINDKFLKKYFFHNYYTIVKSLFYYLSPNA